MNKHELIEKLSEKIKCNREDATKIIEVFNNNFFISKSSKDKIISEIEASLQIEKQEANHIYLETIEIIKEELKNNLKHPFRSKD